MLTMNPQQVHLDRKVWRILLRTSRSPKQKLLPSKQTATMRPRRTPCLQMKLVALIPVPEDHPKHRCFLAREAANADSVSSRKGFPTVTSLPRPSRWTPESSHRWRGRRQAVTSPEEDLGPSCRAGSSAPGNIPPLHQRSRSPEHKCSLGWRLPGTPPCTPESTRRDCTVGRARTCPAGGDQPWGKGWGGKKQEVSTWV